MVRSLQEAGHVDLWSGINRGQDGGGPGGLGWRRWPERIEGGFFYTHWRWPGGKLRGPALLTTFGQHNRKFPYYAAYACTDFYFIHLPEDLPPVQRKRNLVSYKETHESA